jgi:uncharacterized low-complexity protein
MVMENQSPEPQAAQDARAERRPWMRRTVTLAAAGALTAGAAAIAVPALASETTSPTSTPSSGYSTEAPEGSSGTGKGERGDCPEGQVPGSAEGRGARPSRAPGDEGGTTQPPETPGTYGSSATSDA